MRRRRARGKGQQGRVIERVFEDIGVLDSDIEQRAAIVVQVGAVDFLEGFEPLHDLSEDSVLVIELRRGGEERDQEVGVVFVGRLVCGGDNANFVVLGLGAE